MPKNILLIDDDRLVLRTLTKYLKSCGYAVVATESGAEALERIIESDFDLIISDIRMPGMSGIETLRHIREKLGAKHQLVPAIIITGYANGEEASRHDETLRISDYLYKPFEMDEFIAIVKKNLEAIPVSEKPRQRMQAASEMFVSLTAEMQQYIRNLKNELDEFDREHSKREERINFVRTQRQGACSYMTNYFEKIWSIVKDFELDKYIIHQNYFREQLIPLMGEPEINKRIYSKPLGYSGDYMVMNYIYDYSGDNSYLGDSSFEMLINNYTCNIPVALSNIRRKNFLKAKILETMKGKNETRIISIGSGPGRELLELLQENKVTTPLRFTFLDLEQEALEYVQRHIDEIDTQKKRLLSVRYLHKDIVGVIRDKRLKEDIKDHHFFYVSGVYDYVNERMASRLTKELFNILGKDRELLICNINARNFTHRAYYDFLGGWEMIYRTEEEMLGWLEGLEVKEKEFAEHSEDNRYLFLDIKT